MNRPSSLVLAALVLALPACERRADESAEADAPPTTETTPPLGTPTPNPNDPLMLLMVHPAGGSTVGGEIQVLPVASDPNGFRINANFKNVPQGEHAWHIHQGACSTEGGPVVVPFTEDGDKPGIAGPVVADESGTVIVEATVPSSLLTIEQLKTGDYSLHLHEKAGKDHGKSIGCSDL